jgi:hypothetical protein
VTVVPDRSAEAVNVGTTTTRQTPLATRWSVRSRKREVLLIAAVVNAVVVLTVGFIQGGWAPLLVLFAIEAGLACLIAAAVVLPIVHRLVKSPEAAGPAT